MAKATDKPAELTEVTVPSSGDALAEAVAQSKAPTDKTYETDLSEAKEVTDFGGTKVVRW